MRKPALLLAASVLVAAPLTAAHASGTYQVSASVSDNKLDLTSADGSNRSTHIKGRVTGHPVSGRKVYFYASNSSSTSKAYRYIGSDTLTSSGRFDKVWKPVEGGSYSIKVTKRAEGPTAEGSDLTRVFVYNFTNLARFYHRGEDNLLDGTDLVTRVDKKGFVGSTNWSTAYEIRGGATAVFDTSGYHCFRINFKLGVSNQSAGGTHTFRVSQGSTGIMSGSLKQGQKYVEPSKDQQARMRDDVPVKVAITGPSDVRFILGNPKAACTYPLDNNPEGS